LAPIRLRRGAVHKKKTHTTPPPPSLIKQGTSSFGRKESPLARGSYRSYLKMRKLEKSSIRVRGIKGEVSPTYSEAKHPIKN